METLPVQALIPIGVILAALIGGFFSLISLIISKEQKTSEFRQQWVDSLRQEISDHIAATITLSGMRESQSISNEQFLNDASEEQQRVASTYTAIKLRVNPNEPDQKIKKLNDEFLDELEKCRRLYNRSQWQEARKSCNRLTSAAIPMLKAEWERVKRGEQVYVWAKRAAMGVTGLALIGSVMATVILWPGSKDEGGDYPAKTEQVESEKDS